MKMIGMVEASLHPSHFQKAKEWEIQKGMLEKVTSPAIQSPTTEPIIVIRLNY